MRYPLASSAWDSDEYDALEQVIASGHFTMGPHVAAFETAFASYVGSRYCVMVNSGSSANLLMVAALRYRGEGALAPGDEIIVPAVSWSTTYFPLYQYGLKLRFVDIDPETLNYDLAKLERAVTGQTKAMMIVNLLGNPNDFAAIDRIIDGRDITLIEDNCESLGAQFGGKMAGTFGVMGSFSSFFSHHISTMEGGLIVTDDEELYHILLSLRAHGWTRNLPEDTQLVEKSADPFAESFRFILPGYNVRPLEMSGAIGVQQLKKLPHMIAERRQNAERFLALMNQFPGLRAQREIGDSSWFGFAICVEPELGIARRDILAALKAAHIDVRPIVAGNFTKNEALKWMDFSIAGDVANADLIDRQGFFIGNHHFPLDEEMAHLEATLTKVLT